MQYRIADKSCSLAALCADYEEESSELVVAAPPIHSQARFLRKLYRSKLAANKSFIFDTLDASWSE
jgi:hypothetical protein